MNKKQSSRDRLLDNTFTEIYTHGYAGTSIDVILKNAQVPKGSMYHHFKSKKALVMAMIRERLYVKMDNFFSFDILDGYSVQESFEKSYLMISKNVPLVMYGCPLYRLMVELGATDQEFDILLTSKARELQEGVASMLREGIATGEYGENLDIESFASYMLNATWGILSNSPTFSSPKNFLAQSQHILNTLAGYKRDD